MQLSGHIGQHSATLAGPPPLERFGFLDKSPLALAAGAVLGLSCANFGFWWLAWFGLAPLMVLALGCRTKLDAFLTGLVFGMGYHLVTLYWLVGLHPLRWLGLDNWLSLTCALELWFFESAHQALLTACFALFLASLPMRAGLLPHVTRPFFPFVLCAPVVWVFLQWVIAPSQAFLGVPVDQLAYSQARVPEVIQVAAVGGAGAVDAILVFVNAILAAVIIEFTGVCRPLVSRVDPLSSKTGILLDVTVTAALVGALVLCGRVFVDADASAMTYWPGAEVASRDPALAQTAAQTGFAPPVAVAVVQPNLSIDDRLGGSKTRSGLRQAQASDQLAQYNRLSSGHGVSVLVLPEAVMGSADTGGFHGDVQLSLRKLAASEKKEILAGAMERSGEGAINTVKVIPCNGVGDGGVYVKQRLVPLLEYIPLGFIEAVIPQKILAKLGSMRGYLIPAESMQLTRSIFGRIGACISSELVYPSVVARAVNKGASLVVNVADYSYFRNQALGQQMVAAACLRAVENGRYIVIATNTGGSAVVDPSGVVSSQSLSNRAGVLLDRVQFLHKRTLFNRWWWMWSPFIK